MLLISRSYHQNKSIPHNATLYSRRNIYTYGNKSTLKCLWHSQQCLRGVGKFRKGSIQYGNQLITEISHESFASLENISCNQCVFFVIWQVWILVASKISPLLQPGNAINSPQLGSTQLSTVIRGRCSRVHKDGSAQASLVPVGLGHGRIIPPDFSCTSTDLRSRPFKASEGVS